MTNRIFNFGAGPAVLPTIVLEQMREYLLALPGIGMSVLEISHRSSAFDEVLATAEANIRSLGSIPDDYHVLFMQGGATHQFAMVPMNLFLKSRPADYIVTGSWAQKAAKEAAKFGAVRVAATTEGEGFCRVPTAQEIDFAETSSYVHLTSNNTIFGTEWELLPDTGDVPSVIDASSNIFSRPIDVARHGLIYAGAQKNMGPVGVTLVIIRDDRLPLRRIPLREKPLPRYFLPYRGLLGLLLIAIAWPRLLKLPVGNCDSSLIQRLFSPNRAPSRGHFSNGLIPSPSETTSSPVPVGSSSA